MKLLTKGLSLEEITQKQKDSLKFIYKAISENGCRNSDQLWQQSEVVVAIANMRK